MSELSYVFDGDLALSSSREKGHNKGHVDLDDIGHEELLFEGRPGGAVIEMRREHLGLAGGDSGVGDVVQKILRKAVEANGVPSLVLLSKPETIEDRRFSKHPDFCKDIKGLPSRIPGLKIPETYTIEEYFDAPFFPALVKAVDGRAGIHKFLIECEDQLTIFQNWLGAKGEKKDWMVQEFIDCPSDHFSTFRVMILPDGKVVAASIMYGNRKDENAFADYGRKSNDKRSLLANPRSKYYLGSRLVTSNLTVRKGPKGDNQFVDGKSEFSSSKFSSSKFGEHEPHVIGGRIVMNPTRQSHPVSEVERGILKAYGVKGQKLPEEIVKLLPALARELCWEGNRVVNLVVGLDFIQSPNGRISLLEMNYRPGVQPIQDKLGGMDVSRVDAYRHLFSSAVESVAAF